MAKDAIVSEDMAKKFASEKETPYTRWVRAEGLDIISSFYVPDLHAVELKPWPRRGGRAVFLNHDASRFRKTRSEEHTSELQSHHDLVCRLLLEKKKTKPQPHKTPTQNNKHKHSNHQQSCKRTIQ